MKNSNNIQVKSCRYVLSYHSDIPYISLTMDGYAPTHEFKFISEHLLEALYLYKLKKVLVDIQKMQLIAADDQRWLVEDWLPRAILSGHNTCAVVNSNHFFNRLAIGNIANNVKAKGFNLELFEEADNAIEWLLLG